MKLNWNKVLLWVPSALLALTAIVFITLTAGSNSERLDTVEAKLTDLETSQSGESKVFTFVFNQGDGSRFRIVCKEDKNTNIFACTQIALTPSPTPNPTGSR